MSTYDKTSGEAGDDSTSSKILLAARVYRASSHGRICSILVDAVENEDWRRLQEMQDVEPDLLDAAPAMLPALIAAASADDWMFYMPAGDDSDVPACRATPPATLLDLLHRPREDRPYPIRVFLLRTADVPAAMTVGPGPAPTAFILGGGIELTVVRSSLTLHIAAQSLPVAIRWTERALDETGLPVEWWERPGKG